MVARYAHQTEKHQFEAIRKWKNLEGNEKRKKEIARPAAAFFAEPHFLLFPWKPLKAL